MRTVININDNWQFTKASQPIPTGLSEKYENVTLPHTWNGADGQDGGNDYYRGKCFYVKSIDKSELPRGDEYYIEFCGANSGAEVFVNGKSAAIHHGGYSAFRVNITDYIDEHNIIAVSVDNSPNDFVYPQLADFTFYGGLYRDVNIIAVSKAHFDLDYYGSPGIMVTPSVSGTAAHVNVKTFTTGASPDCTVKISIYDKENNEICCKTAEYKDFSADFDIDNVHLWNGIYDPYLYIAKAELQCKGELLDAITTKFGCREFKIDPDKGFILNGNSYLLRGVSRHQDRPVIGNALTYEHHKEDIDLICDMGANTVRLAHYQHSQDFYNLCDEKGLIVWAEIPYISKHMPNARENTISQMTELIAQNYNHPSIVVWGLSNEITMNQTDSADMIENHKQLNELVHKMDKTRLTTQAVLSVCAPNNEYVNISDVVSYNHYYGWYGGDVSAYGIWFDKFHKTYPKKAIGLSEYGCEALNWHTSSPVQGDYTEEYQAYYHEEVIKQIDARPYLWATHVWNMFDFAADSRAEGGENGMNHKGLVTFDRKYKKDSFYAYQAWLSDKKMLHICSKRYVDRTEDNVKITVYSNCGEVELFANGVSVGKKQKDKYPFFYFEVPNSEPETIITAKADDLTDESIIKKVDKFNEEYIMKEEGAVINWFEISTPPGRYSVNDTIGDILKTFKGQICALRILKIALDSQKKQKSESTQHNAANKKKCSFKLPKINNISIMGIQINAAMINMAKSFTLKRIMSMAGELFTKEQIIDINKMLNNVKKKQDKK